MTKNENALEKIFRDKKVIITGHTGFKGSWLSLWLKIMGADVTGIALPPKTDPSLYKLLSLDTLIKSNFLDIRNFEKLNKLIISEKPDFIFHLAAQPLVGEAYDEPRKTFETNAIGTLNLLESLKSLSHECIAIIITSDKCYENVEWIWGYKETDRLGGADPYSASKAAAEIIIKSYKASFFSKKNKIKIGIGRAGNVIGGGDWSEKRIIPDAMKSWSQDQTLKLKSPNSTRPWQHVLEPLGGYLMLALNLKVNSKLHGEAFNFGPSSFESHSVLEVIKEMSKNWQNPKWEIQENINSFHESNLLKLNCDKALHYLGWKSVLDFNEIIEMTSEWYKNFYSKSFNVAEFTEKQIKEYIKIFYKRN